MLGKKISNEKVKKLVSFGESSHKNLKDFFNKQDSSINDITYVQIRIIINRKSWTVILGSSVIMNVVTKNI